MITLALAEGHSNTTDAFCCSTLTSEWARNPFAHVDPCWVAMGALLLFQTQMQEQVLLRSNHEVAFVLLFSELPLRVTQTCTPVEQKLCSNLRLLLLLGHLSLSCSTVMWLLRPLYMTLHATYLHCLLSYQHVQFFYLSYDHYYYYYYCYFCIYGYNCVCYRCYCYYLC